MEIGASNNTATLAQTATQSRSPQPAPTQSRETAQLQTAESTPSAQTTVSSSDPQQRVGGQVDTFA